MTKFEIDWRGNDGRCFPKPRTVKTTDCGVCGSKMRVERNVLKTTSLAGSLQGKKRRCDSFECLHLEEEWHKTILKLKRLVYMAEINHDGDFELLKKFTESQIKELLNKHAVR